MGCCEIRLSGRLQLSYMTSWGILIFLSSSNPYLYGIHNGFRGDQNEVASTTGPRYFPAKGLFFVKFNRFYNFGRDHVGKHGCCGVFLPGVGWLGIRKSADCSRRRRPAGAPSLQRRGVGLFNDFIKITKFYNFCIFDTCKY